jgi:hypothetical protein
VIIFLLGELSILVKINTKYLKKEFQILENILYQFIELERRLLILAVQKIPLIFAP